MKRADKDKGKPAMRRGLLDVIQNQIRDNAPPETNATLTRLLREGYSRKRALELISSVVLCEMNDIAKSHEPYDEARYVAALKALPRMPWEETS